METYDFVDCTIHRINNHFTCTVFGYNDYDSCTVLGQKTVDTVQQAQDFYRMLLVLYIK